MWPCQYRRTLAKPFGRQEPLRRPRWWPPVPSWRKAFGHGIPVGANAATLTVRPRFEKALVRTGHEDDFVSGDGCRKTVDLLPVRGLCVLIHWPSVRRPAFWLRIDIEENGREAALPVLSVDLGPGVRRHA